MTTFDPVLAKAAEYIPAATVLTMAWGVYSKARKSVTKWAGALLDNHAHHVQASLDRHEVLLERISGQQDLQLEVLQRIAEK